MQDRDFCMRIRLVKVTRRAGLPSKSNFAAREDWFAHATRLFGKNETHNWNLRKFDEVKSRELANPELDEKCVRSRYLMLKCNGGMPRSSGTSVRPMVQISDF